jgi:hypothetical protein
MTGFQYTRDTKSRSIDTDAGKSGRRNSGFDIDNISVLKKRRSTDGYATASQKNSINIDLSELNKKPPADSRRNSKMNVDYYHLNSKISSVVRRNSSSIDSDLSVLNDESKVDIKKKESKFPKMFGRNITVSALMVLSLKAKIEITV